MNNKDLNKPNKKMEVIGMVLFIAGVLSIVVRVLIVKEPNLTILGIALILIGSVCNSLGKWGLQKTVEVSSAYDIAKAKAVAKGVKEGLKDDDEK